MGREKYKPGDIVKGTLVIRFEGVINNKGIYTFECKYCGIHFKCSGHSIFSEHTKSCGCKSGELKGAFHVKHGHSPHKNKSPEYTAWDGMIQRCTNPKSESYAGYGGVGIKVYDRWLVFENFLADMGKKPGKGYSLERPNGKGNYEPGNCKWATIQEQNRNTSRTRYVVFRGKEVKLIELCEKFNIPDKLVRSRLDVGNWPIEIALKTPVGKKRPQSGNFINHTFGHINA